MCSCSHGTNAQREGRKLQSFQIASHLTAHSPPWLCSTRRTFSKTSHSREVSLFFCFACLFVCLPAAHNIKTIESDRLIERWVIRIALSALVIVPFRFLVRFCCVFFFSCSIYNPPLTTTRDTLVPGDRPPASPGTRVHYRPWAPRPGLDRARQTVATPCWAVALCV